jgi:NAD(P)-dependent dehydrogenase (short-subunit alcohol dehydrogenase family)
MPAPASFSLDGKRALVTGASRGLGAAMARGLAEAGASVALVARGAAALAEVEATLRGRAVSIPADLAADSMPDLVDRAEAALDGPVDIVLHAAGIQHRDPAERFPTADWERVLHLNLTVPFVLSQEIGRRQLATGRPGSHIFVGSMTSILSVRSTAAYTASKSGIYGVVRALSTEWSSHNIRANGIAPGWVRTDLNRALLDDPVRRAELVARIPMGRLGQPEEMAGAAVFLASDASAYVTGHLLTVDGGWSSS